jgi:hypothetical protein
MFVRVLLRLKLERNIAYNNRNGIAEIVKSIGNKSKAAGYNPADNLGDGNYKI